MRDVVEDLSVPLDVSVVIAAVDASVAPDVVVQLLPLVPVHPAVVPDSVVELGVPDALVPAGVVVVLVVVAPVGAAAVPLAACAPATASAAISGSNVKDLRMRASGERCP